ncbi:MAG TPA: sigma-70 family RNA polymerase sigma factor [Myxococcales bacterium]|nr:sigma-70 family RNA polymerase sigma factor [Myxococcales bacterium]
MSGDHIAGLYKTWGPAIYRRCLRLLRDQEAARDATQEVFRKALASPGKLADPDTALPFIYRIATNHCLNERRNTGRRGETELVDLDLASDQPELPQRRLVQRVLSRFDTRTQSIAVAVLVDGMEHEEVADALGISRKTVSRKLARFLEHARKYLERSAA